MGLVDLWKHLQHSNIVQLREVFTTKAFGDYCKYIFCLKEQTRSIVGIEEHNQLFLRVACEVRFLKWYKKASTRRIFAFLIGSSVCH
jgi:hypothetical protein